jgi:hypothetical protein
MKWLKRKLRKWVDDAREEPDVYRASLSRGSLVSSEDSETFGEPMRFTLTKANGGFIVSTRRYDNRTDRSSGDNYIITDEDDLGDAISKIVTMESLKF